MRETTWILIFLAGFLSGWLAATAQWNGEISSATAQVEHAVALIDRAQASFRVIALACKELP